ncbi:glycosyl transferase [Vibrio caribbeanicus]|uniref:Glycosyl transferase n=1 Tax=Vibrio caribbeanicus TaxID=701175 RepID=A0ACC4P282_9VIBR|nr:glycosyltransferase family 4 protein [Vibrio caribbeanicus]KHD26919.1 glycosyl transferase [Vibrio caribbeanicus]
MSNNTPTSVWLIIDSLTFGGIESHVIELAKGLKHFGVDVKVWLVRAYQRPSPLYDKLVALDIPCDYLANQKGEAFENLLKLVKRHRPNALHAHGYKASLLCKLTKLFTGINQISTYHAGETPTGWVKLYDLLDRYSAMISSTSIAVSAPISDKLPVTAKRFNNFIDTGAVTRSSGKQTAFVGRLSHEKAADRFVRLAQSLPQRQFDIYGTGPDESKLQQIAPPNLTFHGHQTNMNAVWEQIDVLIICSRFEGLPMTALEAMARGIIVMAVNVGSLDTLLNHQQNGYLFDDFDQLSEFYRQWIELPSPDSESIRQNAKQTVQDAFSQQAVIPQLLDTYQS